MSNSHLLHGDYDKVLQKEWSFCPGLQLKSYGEFHVQPNLLPLLVLSLKTMINHPDVVFLFLVPTAFTPQHVEVAASHWFLSNVLNAQLKRRRSFLLQLLSHSKEQDKKATGSSSNPCNSCFLKDSRGRF